LKTKTQPSKIKPHKEKYYKVTNKQKTSHTSKVKFRTAWARKSFMKYNGDNNVLSIIF